jgi:hypothetical protein
MSSLVRIISLLALLAVALGGVTMCQKDPTAPSLNIPNPLLSLPWNVLISIVALGMIAMVLVYLFGTRK